jgi:hypothetical protein
MFRQGNLLSKVHDSHRLKSGSWAQSLAEQAKAFRIARGNTPVAQMPFVSQVPLAWQRNGGEI